MTILAFDTATNRLCAAISGPQGSAEIDVFMDMKHQERLIETLDIVCALGNVTINDVSAVVCGRGPGSFTGLRVAMATAKALSLAQQCPMSSVSTLDAIAMGMYVKPPRFHSPLVLPVIDAKKQRFYGAFYHGGKRVSEYLDLEPSEFAILAKGLTHAEDGIIVCGPDAQAFMDRAQHEAPHQPWHLGDHHQRPWGRALLDLGTERIKAGNWDTPDSVPEYVRQSDAESGLILKNPG